MTDTNSEVSNAIPLKNLAIVAHVDHGKTTLVDGLLKQSQTLGDREEISERVMDSGEIEKERGITIRAKNCAIHWKGLKINLLDTPGHSDFGGEVERSLSMVDGVLLLVDASEGPLPQTRYVLQKTMELGLKIAVVINKVDRPDERTDEVKQEVEDLILDMATLLNIEDFDFHIPFLYASAKEGWASLEINDERKNLHPILDFILGDFFPHPKIDLDSSTQLLVTNLSHSSYLGPLVVGRLRGGVIEKNSRYLHMGENDSKLSFKVSHIQIFEGLKTVDVDRVTAGEIVMVAGLAKASIGDTICSEAKPHALPRISVDPPTVSVRVSVNTSPKSGLEGEYLTGRKLEEKLKLHCLHNVALSYEPSDDPKVFILKGRGELQLAIVFEEIRRSGYELMVGRPMVLYKYENDQKLEPFENVVVDVPSEFVGALTELFSKRKGMMSTLNPLGEGRSRLSFDIPARGLIGLHSRFLTLTKGQGIMSSHYTGHQPYAGDMLSRQNGSLVADRSGKVTAYALYNLLNNGRFFVEPGDEVYEGQVVGESKMTNEMNLNVVREKHLSSMRTAGKDENLILPPIDNLSLEVAMDWIEQDEWVEVSPKKIRIRKMSLDKNKRGVIRKK